jgi:hypothetical protein
MAHVDDGLDPTRSVASSASLRSISSTLHLPIVATREGSRLECVERRGEIWSAECLIKALFFSLVSLVNIHWGAEEPFTRPRRGRGGRAFGRKARAARILSPPADQTRRGPKSVIVIRREVECWGKFGETGERWLGMGRRLWLQITAAHASAPDRTHAPDSPLIKPEDGRWVSNSRPSSELGGRERSPARVHPLLFPPFPSRARRETYEDSAPGTHSYPSAWPRTRGPLEQRLRPPKVSHFYAISNSSPPPPPREEPRFQYS